MRIQDPAGPPAPETSAPAQFASGQAASEVAELLRREILTAVLRPGERLRFEALRARTGASVGAIREALVRLQGEGLVRGDAGRGFAVAPVSLTDLEDIEALRLELEPKALRSSLARGDDGWEAALVSAFYLLARSEDAAAADPARLDDLWDARHRAFHAALLAACSSPWTLHFCALLFDQGSRYRRLSARMHPSPRHKLEEHRGLLDAALARDADAASARLSDHIRGTRLMLLAHLTPGPGGALVLDF